MKNIFICGVGSIGKRHIENFSKFFDNVDIADTNTRRINESLRKYKIRNSYSSAIKALSYQKYDAVVIATPPHTHYKIAKKAIEKKTNLFIEKPLGMNANGWLKLHNICKKNKLISYVGYCHRLIPYTIKLKELIDNKIIGKIIHANLRWGSYLPDWHPWESYKNYYMSKKEQGGGALRDESHGIDLIRYIIGEVNKVSAMIDNTSKLQMSSDDVAFLTFKMKNQALVQINFDVSSRFPRINLEIVGNDGTIIWDRVENNLKIFTIKNKKWKIVKFSKKDLLKMYSNQAKHFYNCIYNKQKPSVDIKDAIQTQKIIDAAFLAHAKQKTIKI